MKKRLYSMLLWILRWMGADKENVPDLCQVRPEDIKDGKMYEWMGRYVIAEECSGGCVTYRLRLKEDSTAKAFERIFHLALKDNNCEYDQGGVVTTDKELADMMREERCEVIEEQHAESCHKCCMYQLNLPCPECDLRHIFSYHSQKRQYATDQKMYQRIMAKRMGV